MWMSEFPQVVHIPLDKWIDYIVDWMSVEWAEFFKAFRDAFLVPLVGLEKFLMWLPWYVVILAVAGLAWYMAGSKVALGSALGLFFIGSLGLWERAMETMTLVIVGTLLAIIVAVPTGIAMARSDLVERLIRPVLDLMQTMPSFVYLVPAVMFFNIGKVPAVLATFIYAVPPAIRLTNLGIRQVPAEVVEAAKAFGSTPRQLLFKVQLPLAMPTILAGINQTVMMALAMVVVAAYIGAAGLGSEVLNGIARLEVGRGFNGGISIVILAIIVDRISQGIGRRGPLSNR